MSDNFNLKTHTLRKCGQFLFPCVFNAFWILLTFSMLSSATTVQIKETCPTKLARWHPHVVNVLLAQAEGGGWRATLFILWGVLSVGNNQRETPQSDHLTPVLLCSQQGGCTIGCAAAYFASNFHLWEPSRHCDNNVDDMITFVYCFFPCSNTNRLFSDCVQ